MRLPTVKHVACDELRIPAASVAYAMDFGAGVWNRIMEAGLASRANTLQPTRGG